VRLPAGEVDILMRNAARGNYELVVDLAELRVSDEQGFSTSFSADAYGRELLLRGLDEIGRTLLEEPSIAAYERSHS